MSLLDSTALLVFLVAWLLYEPILSRLSIASGLIHKDMSAIRLAWMRTLVTRSFKMYDSNLMAHAVNSAGFFASANLLLIGAIAGALFTGQINLASIESLGLHLGTSQGLSLKLALILVCLSRGLLNFIWALRQMNYCAAAFGAIPETVAQERVESLALALTDVLEPAMTSFSQGVRGYYFSLAAAAWVFGPLALLAATAGAIGLLGYRQMHSQSAKGLRAFRNILQNQDSPKPPTQD